MSGSQDVRKARGAASALGTSSADKRDATLAHCLVSFAVSVERLVDAAQQVASAFDRAVAILERKSNPDSITQPQDDM